MPPRERNPVRSRARILAAGLEEFAAHGYAGARVDVIADKAGLNKQLISHHFGGKQGLYQAVMRERRARGGGELDTQPTDTPNALATFFERARQDPEWIRVLLWEALETGTDDAPAAGAEERKARYDERTRWVCDEQAEGRLPADLDPTMLLLSLFGAALYPVLLPQVSEITMGLPLDSPEFAERYADHLRRLAMHLGAGGAPAPKAPDPATTS